jgi:hypothetical protein
METDVHHETEKKVNDSLSRSSLDIDSALMQAFGRSNSVLNGRLFRQ